MATRSGSKWTRSYKSCTAKGCGRPKEDSTKNPHNHTVWIKRHNKRGK